MQLMPYRKGSENWATTFKGYSHNALSSHDYYLLNFNLFS